MKISKKYLLIILISIITFLIVPRGTMALTIFPELPIDTNYPYIISVYDFGPNTGIRKVYITYCKNSTYQLRAKNSNNVEFANCYDNNGNSQGYAYRIGLDYNNSNITWQNIIDNNVDFSSFSWGQESYGNSYATTLSYNNSLQRLTYYKDYQEDLTPQGILTTILTTNTNIYSSSGSSILFDKSLLDEKIEATCDLKQLGVVKNVSSFTYEVNGIGNALKEPLKGQFAFVGRGGIPLLTNNYIISVKDKNNEDIEGKYEFQCNDQDIGNGCLFKYQYNYIDDIDTPLTLQFTFTSNTGQLDYEYSFYSCNLNNSKMNYTYIDNIGGNNQIVENPSLDNSINDDNVSESDNFLNDSIINNEAFRQDHGLTAIIQAPINFLQSLNSKTCSNITLPLPYLGNATIPCMSSIYSSKFNDLYNLLKIIINGVLCYRMALSVVMIIKGAKDPNDDKIEVMDL